MTILTLRNIRTTSYWFISLICFKIKEYLKNILYCKQIVPSKTNKLFGSNNGTKIWQLNQNICRINLNKQIMVVKRIHPKNFHLKFHMQSKFYMTEWFSFFSDFSEGPIIYRIKLFQQKFSLLSIYLNLKA